MNATENYSIRVEPTQNSRLSQVDFDNLKFGKILSDHMLVANYDDGEWKDVSIVPYGDISISPSMSALHYGQAIFEGIKAYKFADGTVSIFRPDRNWERFNKSAARLQMPEVPEEIFMDGLSKLLDIDRNWIPAKEGSSLYIRPFMFATEAALGVHPSKSYKFIIITGPVGAYYSKAISLKVETYYTRAAEGGVGFSKNAGNYALSLYPTQLANDEGYDQIMWTDASESTNTLKKPVQRILFSGLEIQSSLHMATQSYTVLRVGQSWNWQKNGAIKRSRERYLSKN
ncbi:hypothetical protein QE382_000910 [Sphingobacterium zeae]|uniref:Branched-chain-amino-acid transaminase n=1 Tax=Sphingobacterium zeae TaxID=1776859 RepID=A0ABU0U1U7_9SPHI|nr:hypothetical protein [Sphingobacterium zeae]